MYAPAIESRFVGISMYCTFAQRERLMRKWSGAIRALELASGS